MTTAKSKSKKVRSMQPPQRGRPAVAKAGPTLIGFDEQQKAWAARFIDVKPDLVAGPKGADKVEFKTQKRTRRKQPALPKICR
jgi:hypothetical protein